MFPPSSGSGGDLRALLVQAARQILSEPDTPFDLRKVAERAGKSRSAPYVAFGKTEEGGGLAALRLAVAAEGLHELVNGMRRAVATHRRDPEEGLQAMAAAYLEWAMDNPRLFRLAFGPEVAADLQRPSAATEADRNRRAVLEARHDLERVVLEAIEAQAPGYLRARSPGDRRSTGEHRSRGEHRLASGAIWAMLHGVATLTLDGQWELTRVSPSEDPRRLAEDALRFLTHASTDALRNAARSLEKAKSAKEGVSSPARRGWVALQTELEDATDLDAPHAMLDASAFVRGAPARSRGPSPERTASGRPGALRRARAQLELLQGARILWVDDRPHQIRHEREMLEGLGARVAVSRSTGEAAEILEREGFALIISDIERGGDHQAGLKALQPLRELGGGIPVVLYVQRLERELPVPAGAFGITNDPEELLHLVLDGLGRVRG